MAFPATLVWEYRTTGNNLNAGIFDPSLGGVDYSQQDAAQVAFTDLVIGATNTQLTSVATPFTDAMVGNGIAVASGTGFTVQLAYIISVAAGVATMDRPMGTAGSTGGVGKLGGGLALPTDAILETVVAGNIVWIKSGTYTLTSAIALAIDGTATLPVQVIGYNTTRGDDPTGSNRPLIAAGSNTWWFTGLYWNFNNVELTTTAQYGFNTATCTMRNCKSTHTGSTNAFAFRCNNGTNVYIDCEASSTNASGFNTGTYSCNFLYCYAHDCGAAGWDLVAFCSMSHCIADTCATGIKIGGYNCSLINNTIYNAVTAYGIDIIAAASQLTMINNIINTYYGTAISAGPTQVVVTGGYNNYYGCNTDRSNGFPALTGDNDIDPQFTDAANGNFTTGANVADTGRGITLGVG